MSAMNGAASEVATTALGFSGCQIVRNHTAIPAGHEGAYMALIGQDESVQLGLLSTPRGCQALAKALLQMAPEDEDLGPPDLADAVCEVTNIITGGVKTRVNGRGASLALGLPIFVGGAVRLTNHQVLAVAEVLIGDVPAALVLIEPRAA
jgi:hypothetical protein